MRRTELEERGWMKKGELYPPPFLGPSTHLEKATLEPLYNETTMNIHFQVGVGKGWGCQSVVLSLFLVFRFNALFKELFLEG